MVGKRIMNSQNSSRTEKVIKNTVVSFLNRFVGIFFAFALRTAFIRILGVEYTGISSLFTSILSMLSLSELGFGTAIATALYKPLRENDKKKIQKLMHFYRTAYRCVAILILIIGIILLPYLDKIVNNVPNIKEDIRVIFILYIINTSMSYLMIYKTTLLIADQKLTIVKIWETICQVVRYVVEIVGLIIFHQYMLYLIVEAGASIIQNFILSKRAEKEYPGHFEKPEERLSKSETISLLKDVKGLSMYKISGSVANSVDDVLISSFISTVSVGYLSNYTLIRRQVQSVLNHIYTALLPSIGNYVAEKNEGQLQLFNKLFYISFLLVNFCSASMFIIFDSFITWWLGEQYTLGYGISFVIAFDFFLYISMQVVATFRTANGLFTKGQYRPVITSLFNVAFSVLLIKRFGIMGTIFATSIARLCTQWYDPFILYKYIFKESFIKFYFRYWYYMGVFISGCFVTYLLANSLDTVHMLLNVLIRGILCVLAPNLWALIFTFKSKEFKEVKGLLNNIVQKVVV